MESYDVALDISFECGVLPLLMTSPASRARADLGIRTLFLVQGGMRSPQGGEIEPL